MDNYIEINSDYLSRPVSNLHYEKVRNLLNKESKLLTIVVQGYSRIDKLCNCVESVLKFIDDKTDLILLDNGSEEDEVMDFYKKIDFEHKKIIRVTKNITGVYSINKVLHKIETRYILWVNSDVYLTKNVIENLVACAESDDSIGMVVPASTNISNLQIETLGGFNNLEEMQKKAELFNISDPTKWEEKIRLIPTATLYRREIFDTVGLYDLGFMHDFGDDDYTFRVRRAGYKLMLCRDTFVHHDHDQTALPQERLDIMANSREFFKEKHHGIDAWGDTSNYIDFTLNEVKVTDLSDKKIMAIDVKCGTPILNIKNFLRKRSVRVNKCKAYTTEGKYYIDLQSISDEVCCGDVERMVLSESDKYDFVVIGKPINCYDDPFAFIRNIISCMNENAVLIFAVRNTSDVRAFCDTLNISISGSSLHPQTIKYQEFLEILEKNDFCSAEINTTTHSISDDLKGSLIELLSSMGQKVGNQMLNNMMIEDYWITAKR